MCGQFGRSHTWLSFVFLDTVEHLCQRYREKLWWDRGRLTLRTLKRYEAAITAKGGIPGIWGWVDGTLRAICRPSTVHQRPYYSGYKKMHAFKCQGIMSPDGIMSSVVSLVEGSMGDWQLWKESGIEDHLRALFFSNDSTERLHVYRDPAYYGGLGVMGAYRA
jgi:hypothetical protein